MEGHLGDAIIFDELVAPECACRRIDCRCDDETMELMEREQECAE